MILQALYQLAEDENLIQDPDFEWKPVRFLIRLDENGRLLGFQDTQYTPPPVGKKKPKPIAKKFLVPVMPARTSGDYAFWLFDKAEYVLGVDPTGKRSADALEKRAAMFQDRVRDIHTATGDQAVAAVLQFLKNAHSGGNEVALPKDCASNDLFAFVLAEDVDQLVTDRPEVKAHWKALRANQDGERGTCLVTGKEASLSSLFPQLKRVPGGSTSGVGLVSFNQRAFESYGWSGNENAPVSREAAEVCATALNRLLDPAYPHPVHPGETLPVRHYRLSADTVVVFWAPSAVGDGLCSVFASLFDADPAEVSELYRSVWRGRAPEIKDSSPFYALILTGTQGRAIVRDWFESTVERVATNIAAYFGDIGIVRNTPKPKGGELPPHLPLSMLLQSLAPHGRSDDIPAALASAVMHAALAGPNVPFPISILQRALERMRAEIGKNDWIDLARRDARAALIKAVLNRRNPTRKVTKNMDPNNANPGYLIGRLVAVIERMQQLALGDVNATVVDRFFSGTSAAPAASMPRLLKNMRHHAAKVRDEEGKGGTARWLEREADGIMARLNGWPSHLNVEQQGLFVLGYHHERHWLWQSKEDREAALAATAAE